MSAYRSHMGRDALENGPHEPRMVPCWRCGGIGFVGALLTQPCRTCDTDGEIPADECTCLPYPYGDGPEFDCPQHGATDGDRAAMAPGIEAE